MRADPVFAVEARVGKWQLSVSIADAVTAHRAAGGPTYTASLTRFPGGYRVGHRWYDGQADRTGDVPDTVKKRAAALARTLTRL